MKCQSYLRFPSAAAFLLVSCSGLAVLRADLVEVDGNVPAIMNAGGAAEDPVRYIIGSGGAYSKAFESDITVGETNVFNQLAIQAGSQVSSLWGYIGKGTLASHNQVTVSGSNSGWSNSSALIVGQWGSGNILRVEDQATVSSSSVTIGAGSTSNAEWGNDNLAVFTGAGSLWTNSSGVTVGNYGSRNTLTIENGGSVEGRGGIIGGGQGSDSALGSNNRVTVTGVGSSWKTGEVMLTIGQWGSGNALRIEEGGEVSSYWSVIGAGHFQNIASGNNNDVTVSGVGSKWTISNEIRVGTNGSGNTLMIEDGGSVSVGGMIFVGYGDGANPAFGNHNNITIKGAFSALTSQSDIYVGYTGSGNTINIEDGGTVTSTFTSIGWGANNNAALGNHNSVTVTGAGSIWTNTGTLTIGGYGSHNNLTIADGALVKLGNNSGQKLSFSTLGSSSDNFLRLDGGYIALFGDEVAFITQLLGENLIQRWNGMEWVSAFGSELLSVTFYANDFSGEAAALAATGYGDLGGYTIVTVTAVPEPTTWALLGLAFGALLICHRPHLSMINIYKPQ